MEREKPKGLAFTCKFPGCCKVYSSYTSRERHREVHEGIRYTCPRCQASFAAKNYLSQHLKRNKACLSGAPEKKTIPSPKVVCSFEGCGKEIFRNNYKKHLDVHAGICQKKPCPKCGKELSDLSKHKKRCLTLEELAKAEEAKKPFQCGSCLSRFSSIQGINRHSCKKMSQLYEIHLQEGEEDLSNFLSSLEGSSSADILSQELLAESYNLDDIFNSEEVCNATAMEEEKGDDDDDDDDNDDGTVEADEDGQVECAVKKLPIAAANKEEERVEDPLQELLKCCVEYNAKLMRVLNCYN